MAHLIPHIMGQSSAVRYVSPLHAMSIIAPKLQCPSRRSQVSTSGVIMYHISSSSLATSSLRARRMSSSVMLECSHIALKIPLSITQMRSYDIIVRSRSTDGLVVKGNHQERIHEGRTGDA